jgi:lipopolysaccharide export system permease protein
VFNNSIPNLVLYANRISAHNQIMEGIFIFDERDPSLPSTITARKGRISSNPKQMSLQLHLIDGSMIMVGKDLESSRMVRFKSYDLNVELSDIMNRFSSREKSRKEMTISELRHQLKKTKTGTVRHNKLTMELQRKFSIPFACLLLGLIGFPLGLMMRAKGRSWGITLGIVILMIYYILLLGADAVGTTGKVNPVLAKWIPNMVMGAATLMLVWQAARDT